MIPVRVTVETEHAVVQYLVHANNRSKHSLTGAVRAAWRRYPKARAVSAEFTHHYCDACLRSHASTPVRRAFRRSS